MTTFGIDISHHQGDISLIEVAQNNSIDFALAKLSEGDGFVDDQFTRHSVEAHQAGLLFAGYHYLRGDVGAINQAKHVKNALGDTGIPVVIDIERTNGSPQPTMAHVQAFVRSATTLGVKVSSLLYLPEWYWSEIGRPLTPGWDLWQSNYGSNDGKYPGNTSDRWSTMGRAASILQFTSNGRVDGYSGPVDLNAFRGTRAELAQQGWFIDYQEEEVATQQEIQKWVATAPIIIDKEGNTEPLQKVLRQILTNQKAAGVVPTSPAAGLTLKDVETAVANVLRKGVE